MRIIGGRVFDVDQGFVFRDLCTSGVTIAETSTDDTVIDACGCYIIPALTDVHFHGCVGEDFSDGDAQGLEKIADYQLSRGVGQFCPAGMTLTPEQLRKICKIAANHRKNVHHGATLCGVHLEGPFLAAAKKGAQNGAWLQAPNLALFQQLVEDAEGLVKLISIAPELEGAMAFITQASRDITVSVAHTTADYDIASQAFAAGARHVTHLYNAMPAFTHRAPGVLGAALDNENVMVELICDGVHIHPSVVRATFRMFGADRMVLVSDTMRAAGLSDGNYTLGGQDVTVSGRYATLESGVLAGSVTDLMSCMKTAVSMGIALEDAVTAAAVNPAKAIGIAQDYGTLDCGKQANFVMLDDNLDIVQIYHQGERYQPTPTV